MSESNRAEIKSTLLRYLIAVWTVAAAFMATLILSPLVQPGISPLFLLAVMISSWRGGLGAGLFATLLSAFASAFVFLPPRFSLEIDRNDWLQLIVFSFAAVVIGSLSAARRRAEEERERLLAREQAARIEAERANAVKDEFLAAVSHELRTPLATIKTLTRVMQRRDPDKDQRAEYLQDIATECDRQIDLVDNLLDISRIKAGGFQIELECVDVRNVLNACEKIERVEAEERNHRLSLEIEPELPFIQADHGALRRALCTIIENAIKYTPDGGSITLRAFRKEEKVALEVEDNGRGISADDIPFVFDKFYRGNSGSSSGEQSSESDIGDEVPGIGLGLHLARVLIEGMKGSIEVRSRLGQGSTFTVLFPVWKEEISTGNQQSSLSSRTVLAVADGR